MPLIYARAEISQAHADLIKEICGDMPLDDYFADALLLGLGHLQEEAILQERQTIYERHARAAHDVETTKNSAPKLTLVPHHMERDS